MDVADFNRKLRGLPQPAGTGSFALAEWASQISPRRRFGNLFADYLGPTPAERIVQQAAEKYLVAGGLGKAALAGSMPGLAALNSASLILAQVPSLAELGRLAAGMVGREWADAFGASLLPTLAAASSVLEFGPGFEVALFDAATAEPAASTLPEVWLAELGAMLPVLYGRKAAQLYVVVVLAMVITVWGPLSRARPDLTDAYGLFVGLALSALVSTILLGGRHTD